MKNHYLNCRTYCTCGVNKPWRETPQSRIEQIQTVARAVPVLPADPMLARLDAILAELIVMHKLLIEWTPILAAMHWQLRGISINGDPPASITIDRNEPVDGTPVDPRTPDIRD